MCLCRINVSRSSVLFCVEDMLPISIHSVRPDIEPNFFPLPGEWGTAHFFGYSFEKAVRLLDWTGEGRDDAAFDRVYCVCRFVIRRARQIACGFTVRYRSARASRSYRNCTTYTSVFFVAWCESIHLLACRRRSFSWGNPRFLHGRAWCTGDLP